MNTKNVMYEMYVTKEISEILDAPTQSLASSWLRETKNIETTPIYKEPGKYISFCSVLENKNNKIYDSFEKALEEGIYLACNYLWKKNT